MAKPTEIVMLQAKAEKLKELLVEERTKYRTDGEFAKELNVRPGTLNKWLNATPAVWPGHHTEEIQLYFGVDIDALTSDNTEINYAVAGIGMGCTMEQTKAKILQDRLTESRLSYKSDREFAEVVGVKEPTMYKWLKGTPVWPDEPNLRLIADYYGISIDQLTREVSGKSELKTKESSGSYNVATFENAKKIFDCLSAEDKKRFALYSVQQSIAV